MKVAILVADGFEQVELTKARDALDEAGAETFIVSPKTSKVRSWNFTEWDRELPVDVTLADAKPEDFDALHLPGGVINPDVLASRVGTDSGGSASFEAVIDMVMAAVLLVLGGIPTFKAMAQLDPYWRSRTRC